MVVSVETKSVRKREAIEASLVLAIFSARPFSCGGDGDSCSKKIMSLLSCYCQKSRTTRWAPPSLLVTLEASAPLPAAAAVGRWWQLSLLSGERQMNTPHLNKRLNGQTGNDALDLRSTAIHQRCSEKGWNKIFLFYATRTRTTSSSVLLRGIPPISLPSSAIYSNDN